jgi:hypothetical protein
MSKLLTRIYSAIENQEDELLDQIENDIDIALEDGQMEADDYRIEKIDDSNVKIHDKVNDEDTFAIVSDSNIDLTDVQPLIEPEIPVGATVSWIDDNGTVHKGELLETGEHTVSVQDQDKVVTMSKNSIKLLNKKKRKSFSPKGTMKGGLFVIKIGDNDIFIDINKHYAWNADDERQGWEFKKSDSLENLVKMISKDLGVKVLSKKSFSSSDPNLAKAVKLAKDLAKMPMNVLEGISEENWDKFDSKHRYVERAYTNLAEECLCNQNLMDRYFEQRAEEIYSMTGTEIGILLDYLEDLTRFVKSGGKVY